MKLELLVKPSKAYASDFSVVMRFVLCVLAETTCSVSRASLGRRDGARVALLGGRLIAALNKGHLWTLPLQCTCNNAVSRRCCRDGWRLPQLRRLRRKLDLAARKAAAREYIEEVFGRAIGAVVGGAPTVSI